MRLAVLPWIPSPSAEADEFVLPRLHSKGLGGPLPVESPLFELRSTRSHWGLCVSMVDISQFSMLHS